MKNHLTLLARLERISPILALRTLFAWEAPVLEDESGITVAEPEDGARELRDPQDRALLGARTVGDDIQIVAHEALLEQPDHDLNLSLQALGFAKNPLRMSAEQFYDRVLCIDAAWCLLQRFKDVGAQDPQEVTTRMLQIAAEWNALRIDCFEGRTSTSKVARVEELRGLLAQPQWKTAGVEQVTLNEDPRGSALSLKFANRTWETEVPAVSMNWQVAQPIAQAKPKARDKNGVRGTGERSKATLLPRATKIRAEVLAVLQAVQITGSEVRIIERLSPKLYKAVNDVLTEMGGKWSARQGDAVVTVCERTALSPARALNWRRYLSGQTVAAAFAAPNRVEKIRAFLQRDEFGLGMSMHGPACTMQAAQRLARMGLPAVDPGALVVARVCHAAPQRCARRKSQGGVGLASRQSPMRAVCAPSSAKA